MKHETLIAQICVAIALAAPAWVVTTRILHAALPGAMDTFSLGCLAFFYGLFFAWMLGRHK